MKVDPETGWNGTVRMRIVVRKEEPKDKSPVDGSLHYDFKLVGEESLIVETSAAPLHFAVMDKVAIRYLVIVDDPYATPKVSPTDEKKRAGFILADGRLTMDAAKSHERLVSWSRPPTLVKLPWAKLEWVQGTEIAEEPTRLKRADLEKLEGTWELKAEPKEGWKGTVPHDHFPLFGRQQAGRFRENPLRLRSGRRQEQDQSGQCSDRRDSVCRRQARKSRGIGCFEGFRAAPPFKVEPTDELSTTFEVIDGKLSLDLSKSRKAFLPGSVSEIQIDWSKAIWEKVKK